MMTHEYFSYSSFYSALLQWIATHVIRFEKTTTVFFFIIICDKMCNSNKTLY